MSKNKYNKNIPNNSQENIDPSSYFEQLEPRIILGSCIAFGGAEAFVQPLSAAEDTNIHIFQQTQLNSTLNKNTLLNTSSNTPPVYSFNIPKSNFSNFTKRNLNNNPQISNLAPNNNISSDGLPLETKKNINIPKNIQVNKNNFGITTNTSNSDIYSKVSTVDISAGPGSPSVTITPHPKDNESTPTSPDLPQKASPILNVSGSSKTAINKNYKIFLSATGKGSESIKYWTIDWGDGTVEQVDGKPDQAKHIYKKTGDYIVKTSVTNEEKTWSGPTLAVQATANQPPKFITSPSTESAVDRLWYYEAKAIDPDGDNVSYSLITGPGNIKISTNSGTLSWTPTKEYIGSHVIIIEAIDSFGASSRQEFKLNVYENLQNRPPKITSIPITTGIVNEQYHYQVAAVDPDGDKLSYTLVDSPSEMTISETGLISWKPNNNYSDKKVNVRIIVNDNYGGSVTQEYQILVYSPKKNNPPVFVSNPNNTHYNSRNNSKAIGSVSDNCIDIRLNSDEIVKRSISIALEQQLPKVDIFLAFDDTGSFSNVSKTLVTEFHKIITELQKALPNVSFAFGIGKFHNYYYNGNDNERPFTLNQPIITTDTKGFLEAIDTALNTGSNQATGSGYESVVEALYQIATGKGFDGNNDGSTLNAGIAGSKYFMKDPGNSGDVPRFDSFISDPENNILPPAGNIGGVGFRQGALPIIIAATDTVFHYQDDGSDKVVGVDGVEIPISYFKKPGYYNSTPYGKGATIQETIDALKKIGAIVIGMGPESGRDPLEALSRLTGGINNSEQTIDAGYNKIIKKGDPYFFNIRPGVASSAAKGIISAIKSSIENTFYDIEVIASKNGVPFKNITGVVKNVAQGSSATFEISFIGDGKEHSFDLQFVKAGTGVILGSIPVTIAASYYYNAKAVDPDGEEVVYELSGETHGATINQKTGRINWSPVKDGLYSFTVIAKDPHGAIAKQSFNVQVGDRPTSTTPPVIQDIEKITTEVNRLFTYKILATSESNQTLSYYIKGQIPTGITINKNTGILSFTPLQGQEGEYNFTVLVTDTSGQTTEKVLTITIIPLQNNRNTKPIFVSSPQVSAVYDKDYRYHIITKDPEFDSIKLRLLVSPTGMVLDEESSTLFWHPQKNQAGSHNVIIQANDGKGGLNTQSFIIVVSDGNLPPIFTSTPPSPPSAGMTYSYLAQAEDPNGDKITYSLDQNSINRGAKIDSETGLLIWKNLPKGEYKFSIYADDNKGGVSEQQIALKVSENKPAKITSAPVTVALKNTIYSYKIEAQDDNGDPITLILDNESLARGMYIDSKNILRWEPKDLGEYKVTITAVDDKGAGMSQNFIINVINEEIAHIPPIITSIPENVALENAPYVYKVIAENPYDKNLTYEVSSKDNSIFLHALPNGEITCYKPNVGKHLITITVTDFFGYQTTQSFVLNVLPKTKQPPVIQSSPIKYNYIEGDNFSYRIVIVDYDEKDNHTITIDHDSVAKGFTFNNKYDINWVANKTGLHNITITVTNTAGLQVTQSFSIMVYPKEKDIFRKQLPKITSTPPTIGYLNETYTYKIVTEYSDDNQFIYTLGNDSLSQGMKINNNIISWSPNATGIYTVTFYVSNGYNDIIAENYTLEIKPARSPVYFARFTNPPPSKYVNVNSEYRHLFTAEDGSGRDITITLEEAPQGMILKNNEVIWTPSYVPYYKQSFTIKAVNSEGNGEIKTYFILVLDENSKRSVSIYAHTNEKIVADLSNNFENINDITFSLYSYGTYLGVNIEDGKLYWTPTSSGRYMFSGYAIDVKNNIDYYINFEIIVEDKYDNPVIISNPNTTATTLETYYYQIETNKVEGESFYYYLNYTSNSQIANIGITSDGLLYINSFYNNATEVTLEIRVQSRLTYLSTTQIFKLTILKPTINTPPHFYTIPPKDKILEIGDSFSYYMIVKDSDYSFSDDKLTFTLNKEAIQAGMYLSYPNINTDYNKLCWTPNKTGSFKVIITVTDKEGSYCSQEFTLNVIEKISKIPYIDSIPLTYAYVGELYKYQVYIRSPYSNYYPSDIDLTLDEDSIKQGIKIKNNIISYTPQKAGDFKITITAKKDSKTFSTQTYILYVREREFEKNIKNIKIISTPASIIGIGTEYRYEVKVSNPNNEEIIYSLDKKSLERGMKIVDNVITWTANTPGGYIVKISAKNKYGSGETQAYRLHVLDKRFYSTPPEIVSSPLGIAVVGREYSYQIRATDKDNDKLFYSLAKCPPGMTIDSETGLLRFTPDKPGSYDIEITISDGNNLVSQAYSLTVLRNFPPQIISQPAKIAYLNEEYVYEAKAVDPNNDQITWSLENYTQDIFINAKTGKVTFTPKTTGKIIVNLIAKDIDGAIGKQTFEIIVIDKEINNNPEIHSKIRQNIQIGTLFSHQVLATDLDNDPLTYSLIKPPLGMTISKTGLILWTPSSDQAGEQRIIVKVDDGRGGYTKVEYIVQVISEQKNEPPLITSTPPSWAVVNEIWNYEVKAQDPDGDPIAFLLDKAPTGMTIETLTGVVSWTPTISQIGDNEIVIRVVDSLGSWTLQKFMLAVQGVNTAPVITSTPPTTGKIGIPWIYQVTAKDAEGDGIEFYLGKKSPSNMTIDKLTGKIAFTSDVIGEFEVEVFVKDSKGYSSGQAFTIQIKDSVINLRPEIKSLPLAYAQVGKEYIYQIEAYDPNGDSLQYNLKNGPTGMEINNYGLLKWTPETTQTGEQKIEILVSDGTFTVMQSYLLKVSNNSKPIFRKIDDKTIVAGQEFVLDVEAIDTDNDPLKYELLDAPLGMKINNNGRIIWQTVKEDAKSDKETYIVTVKAFDPFMENATVSFNVTVKKDINPPKVILEASQTPAEINKPMSFRVIATDDIGIVKSSLLIDGKEVAINALGVSVYVFNKAGNFEVIAKSWDTSGNVGESKMTIQVVDLSDKSPPIIELNLSKNSVISSAKKIVGTIKDSNSDSVNWVLDLKDTQTGTTINLSKGNKAIVNDVIAEINPETLANGSYTLIATASDSSGNTITYTQPITISANYKLGNFSQSFQDMAVQIGGIPIIIQRSYDTFKSSVSSDFGHGWEMSYVPVTIKDDTGFNLVKDPNSALMKEAAFGNGTKITVRMPNGKNAVFTVSCKSIFLDIYQIVFIPEPGTNATLRLEKNPTVMQDAEGRFTVSGMPFNPASIYTSDNYILTTSEGIVFKIDGQTGVATQVNDNRGNRLEVKDRGLTSYNQENKVISDVIFERDEKNRITSITSQDGQKVTYKYNEIGDLIEVNNLKTGKTTMTYVDIPGAPKHYLKSIIDSNNIEVMSIEYDKTGKINKISDANGNPINISYSTKVGDGLNAEVISDSLGRITETVKDQEDNIVRTIKQIPDKDDPQNSRKLKYQIFIEEFNKQGQSLAKSNIFEVSNEKLIKLNKNQYNYMPEDLSWESKSTYDNKGNKTSFTDSTGLISYYTYDNQGNLISTVDPLGNISKNNYDKSGRLLSTTLPSGIVSSYNYDDAGNLLKIIETNPGGKERTLNIIEYNKNNKISRVTDNSGNITAYGYDKEGKLIFTEVIVKDLHDPKVIHKTTTFSEYDSKGRTTVNWQEYNGIEIFRTTYEYDSNDRESSITDKYGLVTSYTYDYAGRNIETSKQVVAEDGKIIWLVSRTVYDKVGQEIYSQEEHLEEDPNKPIAYFAQHNIYDVLGRIIRTERRKDVLINITTKNNLANSQVVDNGSLIYFTEESYDTAGRMAWSSNSKGVKTIYTYNNRGQLLYTSTDLDGDLNTITDRISTEYTVYDDLGRKEKTILDRDGDFSTTSDQLTTSHEYDKYGRVVATNYPDLTSSKISYDKMGRKINETDQLGRVTYYEYDQNSKLIAVILPAIKNPVNNNFIHIRYEYSYDIQGNQILLRDNVFQSDPTDPKTIDRSSKRETRFTYNWQNQQTSRTLPNGSTEYFIYDDQGRQTLHISFEGRVTYYEYDKYDRLKGTYYYKNKDAWKQAPTLPDESITYKYNANNQIIEENSSCIGITYKNYDQEGRLISISNKTGRINYEYDKITEQIIRTWTGSNSQKPVTDVIYNYDKLERLTSVTTRSYGSQLLAQDEVTSYVYDVLGNIDKIIYANGIISKYNYNALNQLKELVHYAKDDTPEDLSNNQVLKKFSYTYFKDGQKSSEVLTDSNNNTSSWEWLYDALGRLITEKHNNFDNNKSYTTNYTYDLAGNRINTTKDLKNDGIIDEQVVSKYDTNDRLLNERKLLHGKAVTEIDYIYNITEQVAKNVTNILTNNLESSTKFIYNLQGRLAGIETITHTNGVATSKVIQEYTYNSSGIKIKQVEEQDKDLDGEFENWQQTSYIIDPENHTDYSQVLEEEIIENGIIKKVITYTLGLDVIAQYDNINGYLSLLYDEHGNTRGVANNQGSLLQSYDYDAYGNAINFLPSESLTNLLYSGEQFNPTSGLQYLRARWYSPETGRFNRLDPYFGDINQPQSFHNYTYGHNNPIMNTDPTGMFSILGSISTLLNIIGFASKIYGFYIFASSVIGITNIVSNILNKIHINKNLEQDHDIPQAIKLQMRNDNVISVMQSILGGYEITYSIVERKYMNVLTKTLMKFASLGYNIAKPLFKNHSIKNIKNNTTLQNTTDKVSSTDKKYNAIRRAKNSVYKIYNRKGRSNRKINKTKALPVKRHIKLLRKALKKANLNEKEIKELVNQYIEELRENGYGNNDMLPIPGHISEYPDSTRNITTIFPTSAE